MSSLSNPDDRIAPKSRQKPLAVPMVEVPGWLGVSRSKVYEEIAAGRLKAVKCGSKTLVPYASGETWLNNLPSLSTQPACTT